MIKNARGEKSEQWEFVSRAPLWFTGERRQNNGIFCQQMLISSSSFICFHSIMIVDATMSSFVVDSSLDSEEDSQKAIATWNCNEQHTFLRHNAYCVNIVLHRAKPAWRQTTKVLVLRLTRGSSRNRETRRRFPGCCGAVFFLSAKL